MNFILVSILGYILGNFSTSFVVGKLAKNIDIRQHGSGNAGATNTFRVLGLTEGLIVFVGDALKGVAAVLLGRWLAGNTGALLAGVFAVIGHNWPVFLGFRGGKGIATSFGVLIILFPKISCILFVIGIVVILISRYVSLASVSAAGLLPVLIIIFRSSTGEILFGVVLSAMALYQHRSNITRLLSGNERKISLNIKR